MKQHPPRRLTLDSPDFAPIHRRPRSAGVFPPLPRREGLHDNPLMMTVFGMTDTPDNRRSVAEMATGYTSLRQPTPRLNKQYIHQQTQRTREQCPGCGQAKAWNKTLEVWTDGNTTPEAWYSTREPPPPPPRHGAVRGRRHRGSCCRQEQDGAVRGQTHQQLLLAKNTGTNTQIAATATTRRCTVTNTPVHSSCPASGSTVSGSPGRLCLFVRVLGRVDSEVNLRP